jgi:hypothetical protein
VGVVDIVGVVAVVAIDVVGSAVVEGKTACDSGDGGSDDGRQARGTHLTNWKEKREGQVTSWRLQKGRNKLARRRRQEGRGALTFRRAERVGEVGTAKKGERARSTHVLESAEGRASQHSEIKEPARGTYSLDCAEEQVRTAKKKSERS